MSRPVTGTEHLLAKIEFRASDIPHPIDLLTIDRAATAAFVSPTTVDSAFGGSNEFRTEVFVAALSRMKLSPGDATWAALRGIVKRPDDGWLSRLLAARAEELAVDPAFPLFLSAFERLGDERINATANASLRALFESFKPFLITGGIAAGYHWPEVDSPSVEFVALIALLAEAYRKLLATEGDARISLQMADLYAGVLADQVAAGDKGQRLGSSLIPSHLESPDSIDGLAALAVDAGVRLYLAGEIRFATSLKVATVRQKTGLSNTAFYRHFGSIAQLDSTLLQRAGREIADGFTDEFFAEVLREVADGDRSVQNAAGLFLERIQSEQHLHVADGRPGRELTPWLAVPEVGLVAARAYQTAYGVRGAFYERFVELLGTELKAGIDGQQMAAALHAASVISDLLIRNAPDSEAAFSLVESRSALLYSLFLS